MEGESGLGLLIDGRIVERGSELELDDELEREGCREETRAEDRPADRALKLLYTSI